MSIYYHLRPVLSFNQEELITLLKHQKIKINPSIPKNAILEIEGNVPRICFVKDENNDIENAIKNVYEH